MDLKLNKIIFIEDSEDCHNRITHTSSELVDTNIGLGVIVPIWDDERFEFNPLDLAKKPSLFANGKIETLAFDKIDSNTLIVLRVRKNHLLTNITLSHNDLLYDVRYNSDEERLIYLFFLFSKNDLLIRPYIVEDGIGLGKKLGENLLDNSFRQDIIKKMFEIPSTAEVQNRTNITGPNFICFRHGHFFINYKGNEYYLEDTLPAKDIIYIMKNDINIDNWDERKKHWKHLRGMSETDILTRDNFYKSYKHFIQDQVLIYEEKEKIYENKLSDFLAESVKINDKSLIRFNPPKDFKWNSFPPEDCLIKKNK